MVSYGLRANEQGIAWIVQQVATLAATTYLPNDPNAPASYTALNQRLNTTLAVPQGTQKIDDISSSLAGAQAAMETAKDRHKQAEKTLTDMLQSIEMVDPESGRGADPGGADQPAGLAADHGDAVEAQPGERALVRA